MYSLTWRIADLLRNTPDALGAVRPTIPMYYSDLRLIVASSFALLTTVPDFQPPVGTLYERTHEWGRRKPEEPNMVAGTSDANRAEKRVRIASPEEFYRLLVGHTAFVSGVFHALAGRSDLPQSARALADVSIATAYWEQHQGLLLPPCILDALVAAAMESSGERFLQLLTSMHEEILRRETSPEEAMTWRDHARVGLLRWGGEGKLTDRQVAVAELMSDLLVLQRAEMEDLLRLEDQRTEGNLRADLLWQHNSSNTSNIEVFLPRVATRRSPDAAIPAWLQPLVKTYAAIRTPFDEPGILSADSAETL